ncbi:ATP synthase F1 subunit epsilon [Candidatus Peregrinibacteria bacterium]|nr:ATP synthase F1 subunit epsilon [Candidatus Peregrinibacteria bacterium]MBI3816403.1 ATP synthase F1 subunit epsilon [Candidatus Peregrinibacteria bacterium]
MSLHLEIITPDHVIFEGEADSISLPTPDGEITVLPHHIPLMSILVPGSMVVRRSGEEEIFAVSGGVIEVDGKSIRVLADTADRAEGLEEEAILKAKAAAEKLLTEKRHDVEGFAEATAILDHELGRLKTVRRRRATRRTSTGS